MSQGKGVKRVNDAHRSSKKPAEKLGLSMWRPLGIDRSSVGGVKPNSCCEEFCCNRSREVGCLLLAKAESSFVLFCFVLRWNTGIWLMG